MNSSLVELALERIDYWKIKCYFINTRKNFNLCTKYNYNSLKSKSWIFFVVVKIHVAQNKFIAGIPEGLFRAIGHSANVNLNLSWFGQSLVQDFTIQDIKHHKVGFQLKYSQFRDQVNKSVKNMLCLKYKIAYVSRTKKHINPFVPNAPFLYPLKTCFQGVEKECTGKEWVDSSHAVTSLFL